MSIWARRVIAFFVFILLLVIVASVLYGTWNYVIPRLMHSCGACTNEECTDGPTKFTPIQYGTAWVFMFMLIVMFGPGTFMNMIVNVLENSTEPALNSSRQNSARRSRLSEINISPMASQGFAHPAQAPLQAFHR